eukprot:1568971-Rhodomonas_salina.2
MSHARITLPLRRSTVLTGVWRYRRRTRSRQLASRSPPASSVPPSPPTIYTVLIPISCSHSTNTPLRTSHSTAYHAREWLMWPELEKAVLEAVGTTAQ